MLYDEKFLQALRDDPVGGIVRVCEIAENSLIDHGEGWSDDEYQVLTEAYALLTSMHDGGLVEPLEIKELKLSGDVDDDCRQIYQYLVAIKRYYVSEASTLRLEALRSHFNSALSLGFCYEFSQGDLDRVQSLINELRDLISASILFEEDHKHRLLKRMEKLQMELHKKVSDLDRFWGLVGDAGVALGKFGKEAKPLVDRITEIARIVWRTQARAEELPSEAGFPVLGSEKED